MSEGQLGYISALITIFIGCGILTLAVDVAYYRQKKMKRERKTSRVLGWTNIWTGIALLVSHWLMSI
ncbi:hypothetical protein IDH44_16385 [Paenibacillus sp. IB182496]|uniref:Uncharacterized protein n=1 Tax=Paenibacillus sabuli TaxID=2772509 RepID=A0A927BU01_9BACL|nr:CLC_0170 family protein [Paenibacillus sabuli]MBD2846776.1 hypothetical protein [Paenibacillus sabuli]